MCEQCWEDAGCPIIRNEKTHEVVELIKQIHEYNAVGSNLHIVLDDFNIEDHSIQWCLNNSLKANIHESTKEELAIETRCAELLLGLSLDERNSVVYEAAYNES